MPILIAAVAIVGVLCLLDLLLTFGVIRRLREHTQMLTTLASPPPDAFGLPAGELPVAFSTVTTEGEAVTGPAGLALVAFFSTCSVCPERVSPFADYLHGQRVAPDGVLVVSVGPGGTPHQYLAELADLALICVEPEGGEIAKAFKVAAFPSFFLLAADGSVSAIGYDPVELPGMPEAAGAESAGAELAGAELAGV